MSLYSTALLWNILLALPNLTLLLCLIHVSVCVCVCPRVRLLPTTGLACPSTTCAPVSAPWALQPSCLWTPRRAMSSRWPSLAAARRYVCLCRYTTLEEETAASSIVSRRRCSTDRLSMPGMRRALKPLSWRRRRQLVQATPLCPVLTPRVFVCMCTMLSVFDRARAWTARVCATPPHPRPSSA